MGSLWSDLPRRLITICVGIPVLWYLWGDQLLRKLFFEAVHLLVTWEWVKMTGVPSLWALVFPIVSLLLANVRNDQLFLACLVPWISFATIGFLGRGSSDRRESDLLISFLVGTLFITIPFRAWLIVGEDFHHLVSVLLTVWNGDTGALVVGRISKARGFSTVPPSWLYKISPNKSLAGLWGGVAGATLTYVSLPLFWSLIGSWKLAPEENFLVSVKLLERLTVGLILGFLAILGDLFESYWKRYFGVKDTGKLLPGHGGIMDRFDSSLLAVLFYHYFTS